MMQSICVQLNQLSDHEGLQGAKCTTNIYKQWKCTDEWFQEVQNFIQILMDQIKK